MLKMYHDQASDDSEEELVYVGQALPIEDHDEVLKKQTPRNQRAHVDKKGRPERLHGAFTGGFSAGYFNTVGSQDGWQPSTFVSSRDKETAKHDIRKPEDFMDDEDFGEHGIAPRKITTTKDYHSEKRPFSVKSSDADITELIISALATPTSISIGAKLMRKLGWKDGQGVGAKRKRRLKIPKKSSMKVYGCTLPSEQSSKDESDDEDDVYSAGLEFAPKDVCPIIFTAKDNNHGLGYSGITQLDNLLFEGSSHSTNISREQFMTSGVNNKKKRGITGQAFGIGVLNEDGDDDDIYTLDNISQYDRVLDGPKSSLHGWTAPTHSASGQLAICESNEGIPGYRLSSKKCKPKKIYKPPQLPRGWRAKHVFIEDLLPKESRIENKAVSLSQKADMKHKRIERALALGETPTVLGSVFDLLSKEDKSRIETAKKYVPPHCQADSSKSLATAALQSTSSLPQKPPIDTPTSTSALALVPTIPPTTTLTAMSTITPTVTSSNTPTDSVASARISHQHSNFKPFAKDPEKQARYEKFLNDRAGTSSSPSSSDDVALTEWERSREREEFARASQLYRPVTGVMASRFTTAKYTDDVDEIIPADDTNKKTAIEQTSEVDAFGKTSREVLEWHPDRLLCKRFNVPNPYPQSTIVGLRHSRSKKYTLENPLAIPENDHDEIEDNAQRSMDAPSATHSLPTTATATHHTQPLPILATWELGTESSGEGKQQPKLQTEVAENLIQEVSEPANTERPSMDLFKAIFSSSDNSSSDDDDDSDDNDDDDVSVEKKDSGDKNTDKHEDSVISAGDKSDKNNSATAASPAPTTSSHQHPTVLSKETVGSDEPRVQYAGRMADTHMTDSHAEDRPAADRHTIDGHVSDRHVTDVHSDRHVTDVHSDRPNASLDTKSVSQTLASHSSDTSREQEKKDLSQGLQEAEQYGPALPSTILIGSDSDTDSFPDVGASAKKHKKKSKKKEKRKSKKKHKHKRSSSDPKEDAKLDDMSLLKKLKSLPTKRRPTAADFM